MKAGSELGTRRSCCEGRADEGTDEGAAPPPTPPAGTTGVPASATACAYDGGGAAAEDSMGAVPAATSSWLKVNLPAPRAPAAPTLGARGVSWDGVVLPASRLLVRGRASASAAVTAVGWPANAANSGRWDARVRGAPPSWVLGNSTPRGPAYATEAAGSPRGGTPSLASRGRAAERVRAASSETVMSISCATSVATPTLVPASSSDVAPSTGSGLISASANEAPSLAQSSRL